MCVVRVPKISHPGTVDLSEGMSSLALIEKDVDPSPSSGRVGANAVGGASLLVTGSK